MNVFGTKIGTKIGAKIGAKNNTWVDVIEIKDRLGGLFSP